MPHDEEITRPRVAVSPLVPATMAVAVGISALVALAMVAPFMSGGTAFGHDIGFHIDAWSDVAHSWRAGVAFPRWADWANGKYGEPRFIFYPPLSWMLGAALSFLLPWKMVPGAFVFLALTLAGVNMFCLAREHLPATDALLAGALYAANPYNTLLVYQRSAYAELLAGALFPLLVLYALRLQRERWRAVAPLALVFAAIWLTNAPAGVLSSYALVLLLMVVAWRESSAAVLLFGAAAIAIGFMLAAVYLVPAVVEQPWVRIHDVLGGGRTPTQNFLFQSIAHPLLAAFNRMVSVVALVQMVALALAAWSTRARFAKAWWPAVLLGGTAALLMVRVTVPLWRVAPQAQFIQFPWRWLGFLSLCVALLVAAALATRRARPLGWVMIGVLLLLTTTFVIERSWRVPGGTEDLVDEALRNGYGGSDEYAPVATDHKALIQELPAASVVAADGTLSDAHAQVGDWGPEQRWLTVVMEKPGQIALRMVSYPAWQAEVNGRVVPTLASPQTGMLVLALPAGKSDIRVRFARTWDRTLGGVVSWIGAAVLLAMFVLSKRRRQVAEYVASTA